jgi:hypothetical protein
MERSIMTQWKQCTCKYYMETVFLCPIHGVSTTTTNNTNVCITCGVWMNSRPCGNCGHCYYCDDTGNIEVTVFDSRPDHTTPRKIKETTWCPHCPEGEIWKELLDG